MTSRERECGRRKEDAKLVEPMLAMCAPNTSRMGRSVSQSRNNADNDADRTLNVVDKTG